MRFGDRLSPLHHRTVAAAGEDVRRAVREFDRARDWFAAASQGAMPPLAVEVWVFDGGLSRVLLVRHRWRGWVPPGGTVEPGETPREAAVRELAEETGLGVELFAEPAAVAVRSYRPGWAPTLGLCYAALADPAAPLTGEDGQPAAWVDLATDWETSLPDDRDRLRRHATSLGTEGGELRCDENGPPK